MAMSVEIKKHGRVVVLLINNPPVNALSHPVRMGLKQGLEFATGAANVNAVVVAGQGGTFIAGADIKEFGKPAKQPLLGEVIELIENFHLPVVAAIEGNSLGGGLEVALGCHYRVVAATARMGLPEVTLGIIPGAGGTQRLPRLIGAREALTMITSGRPINAKKALSIGLVDEVADTDCIEAAIALAERAAKEPFDGRRLSSRRLSHSVETTKLFENSREGIRKRARGTIAPLRAAQCVEAAFTLPFDEGLAKERKTFVELVASDQSKALRQLFLAERAAAKPPSDVSGKPRDVNTVGIVGGGTMGGGIAMTFAEAGVPVTIVEISEEGLQHGLATIEKNWRRSAARGRISDQDVKDRLALITGSTTYEALSQADLIIEAVFETMAVKRQVFEKIDAVAKPGAVLATNTSYLDINEIAALTSRPKDVLGMHYFSPANIMRLLEIVRASETADDALLTALSVAKRTGKNAVVAGVCHGFIGNRMLTPYARQAGLLLLEGAGVEQIDNALTGFGFAMGVFSVGDLAGLDIGYRSRRDRVLEPHEQRVWLIADRLVEAGFLGQKSGTGYYRYDPQTRARSENPQATEIIDQVRAELSIMPRIIEDEEIINRTQFALANEGAHILAEKIAQRSSDIDVVYHHGYGYPRWRGGPMHHADTIGLKAVADAVKKFAEGENTLFWKPAPLLLELAADGISFAEYDRMSR